MSTGRKIVSKAMLDKAWVPGRLDDGKSTDYGFGWGVEHSRTGGLVLAHDAGWNGTSTFIERHVDEDFTIILRSNATDRDLAPVSSEISHSIEQEAAR